MKFTRSLNARLIISHLMVSLISIILLSVFAGRTILQAATKEAEHNLQDLIYVAGNALVLPIQEINEGTRQPESVKEMLSNLFADNPDMRFTIYEVNGDVLVDNSNNPPPRANRKNAPEVLQALESELGRGVDIRKNVKGESYMNMAVLVQHEIEVTAILRLSIPMKPSQDAARRSLAVLLLTALVIASGVSLFGWVLAHNLARPIQILTQAAENMEEGDLGVRVKPSGPQEMYRLAEAFNSMAKRLQTNVNELRAFVPNASHELRTPLTVVKLRTEALREGALEDPEVAMRFLEEIESEVDRLVRMVNDMLDLSRMEAGLEGGTPCLIDLESIADEVYETFKIRAERAEVTLEKDIEAGLPEVMGNEDQVRRVFYNLAENAIRYTPVGGTVELLLRVGPNENTVRFLVRDNGPGISPENISHVFERFYRAETQRARPGMIKGSGLGLAIAKSIVESHGGEMGVSSQVENGSTFWADFPTA